MRPLSSQRPLYFTTPESSHCQRSMAAFSRVILLVCAVVVFFPASPSASDGPLAGSSTDIKQDIEEHRVKIQRLQRGIREQQNKAAESGQQEKNVLEELEGIDARLQAQQKKVATLERQVKEQQELINAKETEIAALQADKTKVLEHLKKRSSAYYKMGKVGFLNVTFSSKSLPELLKFHDSFQTLISYDKAVVVQYRNKILELERARDAYALEKELLEEFVTTAQQESRETDSIRMEKEQLLVHIRTQKHLHDQAIKELEKATETISSSLIALKNREDGLKQTFARSKGHLPPPITGDVITYYNQEKSNKLGILRKSTGIAIKAPDGSKVQAIADGTVIFSGYLRGYGNTVIIHHGFQYYTVTSRLEKVALNQGYIVKTGEHIGLLSDTVTLIDEGLYFEIRHGKKTQDPLQWLDTSNLQMLNPPEAETKG